MTAVKLGLIRWVGGKQRLLPAILPNLPEGQLDYIEPFFGGGALFWRLASEGRINRAALGDSNPALIGMWRSVRDQPQAIAGHLRVLASEHSEAAYLAARRHYNTLIAPPSLFRSPDYSTAEVAALFLYLNATSFNGLYRLNRSGGFNVSRDPAKKPRHIYSQERLERMYQCSELLQGVNLVAGDFGELVEQAGQSCTVYADGPYVDTFAAYTATGFREHDHRRLCDALHRAAARGARVLTSNSSAPAVYRLYSGWEITPILRAGTVSAGKDRSAVRELLLTRQPLTA